MSLMPDYVMSEPGASSRDVTMITEAMGPPFLENEQPITTENGPSLTTANDEKSEEKPMKTTDDLLEEIILKYAEHKSPPLVSKNATDQEKKADRERRLNAQTTRWRIIFSVWPRDPKGKIITAESSKLGKMAPNGAQLWGATLFDFYAVRRIPTLESLVTYSSGSKLAAWMKANGEDYAKSMLDFTENEADPHLILPFDITDLIQAGDQFVNRKSWITDDDMTGKGKAKAKEDWQVPQPWPPASTFDAIAYPKPWPCEPFAQNFMGTHYPTLQKYINHSQLPTILKVHDPWGLLRIPTNDTEDFSMEEWEEKKQKQWSELTDVVHTYRLKISTKNTTRRIEDDKRAKEEDEKRKAVYDTFIADPHSRNELPSGAIFSQEPDADKKPGRTKPPIFVAFPLKPPIPPTREAHLYLSPNESMGRGNHSFVYRAEFELPRSTIMDDAICYQCIYEDMHRTLKEQDGPNGERRDPKWDNKVGRYLMKTAGKAPRSISISDEEEYLFEPDTLRLVLEYDGPYRLIHSKIGYQCLERGPYCEHIAKSPEGIHPLTAKVKVAAKLSIQYDHHLAREAENYQGFPKHFFEHWSGYNVIKPLKEPTPIGPLVPQFYGYYVPDVDPDQSDSDDSRTSVHQYRSPILLMEDCGQELDPEALTLDDQNEAAALVFRFHNAGWFHGSIAKRNILIQPGALSDPPPLRLANSRARGGHGVNWSFRLIDFGRSQNVNHLQERDFNNLLMSEEISIQNWLLSDEGLP